MAVIQGNVDTLSANGTSDMVLLKEGWNNVEFSSTDWGSGVVSPMYSSDGTTTCSIKDGPGGTAVTISGANETISVLGAGGDYVFFVLASQSGDEKKMKVV